VVEVVVLEAGPAGGQVGLEHHLQAALDEDGPGLAPLAGWSEPPSKGTGQPPGMGKHQSAPRD
jgi:hypothetical protein